MNIILYLLKYDSAFHDYNEKLLKNDSTNEVNKAYRPH